MIAIVDYGAGNLVSVKKAFDRLGAESVITSDADVVRRAKKIVLPGVGHFASTDVLGRSGLKAVIGESIQRGAPFLGICVGLQWMFAGSEESPETAGLKLFPQVCGRFPASVKSPHVGWNSIEIDPRSRLFRGVPASPFVYFTHSFRAPISEETVACCEYGGRFAAAVERANVFGVQFHPEKSGETGLQLLRNFCEL